MKALELIRLGSDPSAPFPPAAMALDEPNGLLAVGGDLHPHRVLNAYRQGIFPWYSAGQPILWWSPDPRTVFSTDRFRLSRRDRRSLRAAGWRLRADTDFREVIDTCARIPRPGQHGTWITPAVRSAFMALHRIGHAHSIEVHDGDGLVGGLYGLAIGRMFFAESMFSLRSGGSKAALAGLARLLAAWQWPLIDAQVENDHLLRLGAETLPRESFLAELTTLCQLSEPPCSWRERVGEPALADLLA